MPRKADPEKKIVNAALALAADRGWSGLTLRDIAGEAKMSLAKVYEVCPSKAAILDAFALRVDAAMLKHLEEEEQEDVTDVEEGFAEGFEESPRDRLFDVVMARLDVLGADKDAVRVIAHDVSGDPVALARLAGSALRSLSLMLEAAGIPASGLGGALRTRALGIALAGTFRVWLNDDSPDLAKTMADLDRRLRRLERLARFTRGARSGRTRERDLDDDGMSGDGGAGLRAAQ